jgi:hypothetical protein
LVKNTIKQNIIKTYLLTIIKGYPLRVISFPLLFGSGKNELKNNEIIISIVEYMQKENLISKIIDNLFLGNTENKPNEFIIGKQWNAVPISHDILRNEYWIYTLNYEDLNIIDGLTYRFFRFQTIPTKEESLLLEWKTIDLVNNIKTYSSKYTYRRTKEDIIRAIYNKQLDYYLITSLTKKFGNDFTKNLVDDIIIRGDKVHFVDITKHNNKIFYFQPNGKLCYLYNNKEEAIEGNKPKKVYSVNMDQIKKVISDQ